MGSPSGGKEAQSPGLLLVNYLGKAKEDNAGASGKERSQWGSPWSLLYQRTSYTSCGMDATVNWKPLQLSRQPCDLLGR